MNTSDRLNKLSPEKRAMLAQALRSGTKTTNHRIPRRQTVSPAPLSFSQERLWFMEQLSPGEATYNIPAAFRLQGPLNMEALRESLDTIIQRHEILRTTFSSEAGQPIQVIAPSLRVHMPVHDLQGHPHAEQERELQGLMSDHFGRSFDLVHGPLIRLALVRLAEQEAVILLCMHHIISDAWSMSIFVREFSSVYAARVAGESPVLPEAGLQYADFAVWQRRALEGDGLAEHLAYWKTQFSRPAPVLELPTDRARPPIQAFEGAKKSVIVDHACIRGIKRLAQDEGVTLFMTMLAAFNVLLHRYSHQDDLVVGTPIASRDRAELEQSIGLFVNTLALRTDLSGNPTFRELLQRVRKVALEAYAHQDLSFEKLVEVLQPPRDLSRPPLFQVLFSLQNAPSTVLELSGLRVTPVDVYISSAKFDISMYLAEAEDHLVVVLEYRTDLFDEDTIDRLLSHFRMLLTGIIENPDQRIGELELLSAGERKQLLFDWNNTERAYPSDARAHQLFEMQVRNRPEATAVVCGDERITYRELNERANRLAGYLRESGVGPEVLVAICLDRSIDMVASMLAVWKAGGAYVPLDPSFPLERLAMMLEDAQVKILLTQADIAERLPNPGYEVAVVSSVTSDASRCDADDRPLVRSQATHRVATLMTAPAEGSSADVAYVIYTSGSTGKPKGVRVPHRALVNFLCSMREEPGLTEHDICLAVTTLSFDIAAAEIHLPLIAGAQVILATAADSSDGARLLRLLESSGATVFQATPATWRLLLQTSWNGTPNLKILCGGEAFPWALAQELIQRSASVWNVYGPTETTVWSALGKLEAGCGTVRLTRPLANTQIYLLDPAGMQPVPVGVAGEVFIGGDGVARDYLNRPDLTAEKFVRDPFSERPGARLYRTGDLARRFRDGSIEILGRSDHQVKIRGFRIELGEIEAALTEHDGVKAGIVTAMEETGGEKRLVAYLVAAGEAPTITDLRAYLKGRLPEYMIPSLFVFLDSFPLTPNGKVDRRALPSPSGNRPELESRFVAPETAAHQLVADIWCAVLQVKSVGIHDNFFELGGHSLMATRVIAALQTHNINVPVRTLFESPTIDQLCRAIELSSASRPDTSAPSLVAVSREARKMRRPNG